MLETVIELRPDIRLICPAYPLECTYVRIEKDGVEIVYWDWQEWHDDPRVVMGSLMGALRGFCPPINTAST